jgi:hypothetical protein
MRTEELDKDEEADIFQIEDYFGQLQMGSRKMGIAIRKETHVSSTA